MTWETAYDKLLRAIGVVAAFGLYSMYATREGMEIEPFLVALLVVVALIAPEALAMLPWGPDRRD